MTNETYPSAPSSADRLNSEAAVLVHDLHTQLQAADKAWQRFAPNDPNIDLVTTFANRVAEASGEPALKLAIIQGYLLRPAIAALHEAQATIEEILTRATPPTAVAAPSVTAAYTRLELLPSAQAERTNPSAA